MVMVMELWLWLWLRNYGYGYGHGYGYGLMVMVMVIVPISKGCKAIINGAYFCSPLARHPDAAESQGEGQPADNGVPGAEPFPGVNQPAAHRLVRLDDLQLVQVRLQCAGQLQRLMHHGLAVDGIQAQRARSVKQ